MFRKKYERVAAHISGLPPSGGKLNPFDAPPPVSVFSEEIHDPKMNIPQNRVLFDDVIKYAVRDVKPTDDADGTVTKKRTASVEEEMENE